VIVKLGFSDPFRSRDFTHAVSGREPGWRAVG
jgi:hypothetical protein